MKTTVVLTMPEIQDALVVYMGTRPSHLRKFVAHVEFVYEPTAEESLRLRANVIMFDTKQQAMEFITEMLKPVVGIQPDAPNGGPA